MRIVTHNGQVTGQVETTWALAEAQEAQVTGQVGCATTPGTVEKKKAIEAEARETDRALREILRKIGV